MVCLQASFLELGGSELLNRLIGNGPDQRITQPALYAAANLAAKNIAAQEALHESGTVNLVNRGLLRRG